jgi:hypothetical protein
MYNHKGKVRKCSFQSKLKNGYRDPCQSTCTDLKILQWNAGGLSQNEKTELHLNLVKHEVEIFAIVEANLTAEKLISYQFNGYTLYSLPRHRQIASGILIGVSNSLCAEFKMVKEMGNSEEKSKIMKVNLWKKETTLQSTLYIALRTTNPTSHPSMSSTKP